MVADALAAYETADPDACREIDARDDDLDERCRGASEAVVRELSESDRTRSASRPGGGRRRHDPRVARRSYLAYEAPARSTRRSHPIVR